jgi:hypothetical protein
MSIQHLRSKNFRALLTHLVDLRPNNASDPKKTLYVRLQVVADQARRLMIISSAGIVMVSAIAGIVSTLAGPAAPIVVPIVGCLVIAKWAYDVYQQS